MCGRFVAISSPRLLAERFGVEETALVSHEPDYNVTPRALVPVVRERKRSGAEPARVLSLLRWGLVPSWAESTAIGDRLINARAESVAEMAAFKAAFLRRRCIIPADAFYEWRPAPKGAARVPRQPFLVRRRDGEPLAFAGLWEIWRDPEVADGEEPGAWVRSCVIITTRANALIGPIHDRMPVVLGEDEWSTWLDPTYDDTARLQSFLGPRPDDWFEIYPVSPRVNSPQNNDADLLQPVDANAPTLF